jgi:hypothetical protein
MGVPSMPENLTALSVDERVKRYRVRAEKALFAAQKATDPGMCIQFFQVSRGWNNLADMIEGERERGST